MRIRNSRGSSATSGLRSGVGTRRSSSIGGLLQFLGNVGTEVRVHEGGRDALEGRLRGILMRLVVPLADYLNFVDVLDEGDEVVLRIKEHIQSA
ncbi:hypothetical protein ABL78_8340 [Leptomonas seymouri]|uniref:Uncharacterized protein n=1 Tax=Leptomonas seymouri TaxID=5684 RepID=A0A0N0P282_LEPSE|nr:hypothetical protein ABL78_8340 [Leptomonas seymouri]|eukprot:KPI82646.1 hypothetical protein ABL78_8340 [Leptomonas seymouri]